MLSTAAREFASVGAAMSALKAAADLTTKVVPAAADEVSATTAVRFSVHAQLYQFVSAQAAAIHEQFVGMLASCGGRKEPIPRTGREPGRDSGSGKVVESGRAFDRGLTGRAMSVGGLLVPQTWAVPPQVRQIAAALPFTASPIYIQDRADGSGAS
jgi:hypothetical protein